MLPECGALPKWGPEQLPLHAPVLLRLPPREHDPLLCQRRPQTGRDPAVCLGRRARSRPEVRSPFTFYRVTRPVSPLGQSGRPRLARVAQGERERGARAAQWQPSPPLFLAASSNE